jgi:hypothetical protein
MADLKISQLPAATTPVAGTEVLPIVQSGTTTQVSIANLTVGRNVTATTFLGGLDTNVAAAGLTVTGTTVAADGTDTNIDLTLTPQGSGVVTTAATYSDGGGKLRAIPQSGSAKTTAYELATGDVGKFIEVGASGSIEIPDDVFAAGDVVSIFNNTSGDITITCTIAEAYIAGVNTDETGEDVDLATRGICTILFISGALCVISGNVS